MDRAICFLGEVVMGAAFAGLILGIVVVLGGCGGPGDEADLFGGRVCIPGATAECACPGGSRGAQACRGDGAGYDACQCGGGSGSGGSAGVGGTAGTSGSGGSGTGGAGGSCTGRTVCPAPEPDGGAALCGMLDDYCGGNLSCGCDFGECGSGACECTRLQGFDSLCATRFPSTPIAMTCAASVTAPPQGCTRARPDFPAYSFCCGH